MKAEHLLLTSLNIVARVAGVLLIFSGIVFALMAFFLPSNRFIYGVVAALGIIGGVAFLIAKSIKPADVEKIRRSVGRNP